MSRIRGGNTKPELTVRSLLHRAGYRFRLHSKNLPGRPDIVLPKYATIIFVHGCFWHRHKNCKNSTTPATRPDFWRRKFEGNIRRDERNRRALRATGWRVITVWECEVEKSSERVIKSICHKLGRRH
jgi:DNA mismatch endonuclease (patch repair protein)